MPEPERQQRPWYWCNCVRDFCRSPVGRHLVNARKEVLLAIRECVDSRIERLDGLLEDEEPKRVPVE